MLSRLDIRNLALIERAVVELGAGMSVLTGETGAGKSILIDAVGLVIGERASAAMVREGADRAEVVAIFELQDRPEPLAWLTENELDNDGECILRRTVAADGRSRAFINDRPVSAQTLRDLGELLVDIHGQHAHQSLLKRDTQRRILDEHGRHAKLLNEVSRLHGQWTGLRAELEALSDGGTDVQGRIDFLNFQLEEFGPHQEALSNLESLLSDHKRLSHGADIERACAQSLDRLQGEGSQSAGDSISAAISELQSASLYDDALREPLELLTGASAQLDEAAGALRRHLGGLETDRETLARMEETVSALHGLARKHRVQLEELPGTVDRLQAEIDYLAGSAEREVKLQAEIEATEEKYRAAAAKLSKARAKAAKSLAGALEAQIHTLGMETGKAHVKLSPVDGGRPAPHGLDVIEFEFNANAGNPLRPLAQVASGGELSRIGLAIQVISAGETGVGTFIFDEVDTGIGGRLADMVGDRLGALGQSRQVLCVTHLPQVACHAQGHLRVSKGQKKGQTHTQVDGLGTDERVEELARMLGGAEITDKTLAHARELLNVQ